MIVNSVLHNMQVCDAMSGSHTGLKATGLFSGGVRMGYGGNVRYEVTEEESGGRMSERSTHVYSVMWHAKAKRGMSYTDNKCELAN